MSAGDAAQRVKQQVKEGVAKAQHEFEAAKSEAKRVNERAKLPPAEDADQAAQQVRDLRARMDRDIATLEARIPPRDTVLGQARAVGGAVVGGLALLGTVATLRQQRKEKKAFEEEADKVARAIARHLPAAVAEVSPPIRPRVIEVDDGGGHTGRTLAILALLASAAFAIWTQVRDRDGEADIWGPPPAPTAPVEPPAPGVPPSPEVTSPMPSTAPTSNTDDLFGNRPPAP
ncbi:hypothetical protein [Egicoccus sp. AB-alg6-2]|uniref:hypothetical protein n=1 Tax=Egicoccus sp. AB-alg6-2 TaxID=3242692 RepID=UPI00359E3986